MLISIVCRIELVDKRFSLWEAGEGQFDRDVPEDAKDQEDHDRGPQDYEYSSQELESKPYSMALNLHTIVIEQMQHTSGERLRESHLFRLYGMSGSILLVGYILKK